MEGDAPPSSTSKGNPLPDFEKKTLIITEIVSVFLFLHLLALRTMGPRGAIRLPSAERC